MNQILYYITMHDSDNVDKHKYENNTWYVNKMQALYMTLLTQSNKSLIRMWLALLNTIFQRWFN